jgi:hypothetical protein
MYSQNIILPLYHYETTETTLDRWMIGQEFYHYETTAGHAFKKLYFAIFSSLVPAELKPLTVG